MKKEITERVIEEADQIIETKQTIREIAKEFNISKSTVHKDLHDRLYHIDLDRFKKVQEIMQHHIEVRHLRGGESTRKKYKR